MKLLITTSYIILISFDVLAFCANPLIGSWISDKEKTISYSQSQNEMSAAHIEALEMILGSLKMKFTIDTAILNLDGPAGSFSYKVIHSTDKFIEIELISNEMKHNLRVPSSVIPAQAGIHKPLILMDSRLRGNDYKTQNFF